MKNSIVLKIILGISGLMLIGVGIAATFSPVEFNAGSGIKLGDNISLLNNVRAAGAVLLGSGILVAMGIFIPKISFTSTIIGALLYIGYGIGRTVSIIADGMPHDGLVKATVVEFIIGAACIFALIKYKE